MVGKGKYHREVGERQRWSTRKYENGMGMASEKHYYPNHWPHTAASYGVP